MRFNFSVSIGGGRDIRPDGFVEFTEFSNILLLFLEAVDSKIFEERVVRLQQFYPLPPILYNVVREGARTNRTRLFDSVRCVVCCMFRISSLSQTRS